MGLRSLFTMRGTIPKRWTILIGVLSTLVVMAAYSYLSHHQHTINPSDSTIPGWSKLWEGVMSALEPHRRSGERWLVNDGWATASRLFLGLGLGTLGAVLVGMHMGFYAVFEAMFNPVLSLLAKVPPTAALAVFFVMAGTDTEMYVAMIAFGVLPTLAQSIYLSVRDVPIERIHKAQTLGASSLEVGWNVIFPEVLPKVIDGIRLQIGPAMVFLIAAEMIVGDVGFGYRIRLQSRLLNMNVVYPYLAYLAAFGFMMDYGLRLLQRWLCPWATGGGRH